MGFLFCTAPPAWQPWTWWGSEKVQNNCGIAAADQLLTAQPSGRFLQAWGTMDDRTYYRYIHDCIAQRAVLYWVSAGDVQRTH